MRTTARAGVALVAVALLTACGTATGSAASLLSPRTTPPPSGDGSAVVLRAEQLGGMVIAESLFTRLPDVSVHADGRAIQAEPVLTAAVDEVPALPPMTQRTVTPAGLDTLVERARAAGVGGGADLGDPLVTDVTTARFLLATDAGQVWIDAYALASSAGLGVPIGEPEPSPSISVGSGKNYGTFAQDQADARYRLLDLIDALEDLSATLGAEAVGGQAPYVPQAVAAIASPWGEQPADDALAWPGPPLLGESVHGSDDEDGPACVVVRGDV